MERITSRENERVKYARRLAASGAFRVQEGLFFAEGKRLCQDLAALQRPRAVFCTEELLARCPEAETMGESCTLVSPPVAEKLADTRSPQGLFCLFALPACHADALCPEAGLLLCEELQDPANVGAVLRSAAAFGYGGVVLASGADPFSPKALRASMGAVLRLPVLRLPSLAQFAATFGPQKPVFLAAAAGPGSRPPGEMRPGGPFALMIGNEGAGLSEEALALADGRVGIPMQRGVESLNAAVAASVLMYALKANELNMR